MAEVIGVRFKEVGKIYYFDPDGQELKKGDRVIVETVRGVECGEVALENREISDEEIVKPLKKLIRKAFEHQLNGDGFCLVELLSPCPTNLNMPPVKAREHVHTEMTKYFPIGEYIDKKGGNQA